MSTEDLLKEPEVSDHHFGLSQRFCEKVTWAKLILQHTSLPVYSWVIKSFYLKTLFARWNFLYLVSNKELGQLFVSFELFFLVLWRHCVVHGRFRDLHCHRCHLNSRHDLHWFHHVLLPLLLRSLRRRGGPTGRKKFKTLPNLLWSSLVCFHYHPAVSINGFLVSIGFPLQRHDVIRMPLLSWRFHCTENN